MLHIEDKIRESSSPDSCREVKHETKHFGSCLYIFNKSESSSAGRARPCQGRGRGFESRLSLENRAIILVMLAHFCFTPLEFD